MEKELERIESERLKQIKKIKQIPYAVRQYPYIYDKNLEDYKNVAKVDEAWNDIAKRIGFSSGEAVFKRYNVMKQKYKRQCQLIKSNPNLAHTQFMKSMSFLSPHISREPYKSRSDVSINSSNTSLVFNITANGTNSHHNTYMDFMKHNEEIIIPKDEVVSDAEEPFEPEIQIFTSAEDDIDPLQFTGNNLTNPPTSNSPEAATTDVREPRSSRNMKDNAEERESAIIDKVKRILKSECATSSEELFAEFIKKRVLEISSGLNKVQKAMFRTKLTQLLDDIEISFL